VSRKALFGFGLATINTIVMGYVIFTLFPYDLKWIDTIRTIVISIVATEFIMLILPDF